MEPTYRDWYQKKMYATEEIAKETEVALHVLQETTTIAVVGLSKDRHKDSQFVARYLQNAGIKIIPVNPTADEILGEKVYKSVKEIPFPVDVIDVFLKPDLIPTFIEDAISVNPKAIWLQLGTGKQEEAKRKSEEAGIPLFENRCIKVDHQFLIRPTVK
jgi:uncharacterized protein